MGSRSHERCMDYRKPYGPVINVDGPNKYADFIEGVNTSLVAFIKSKT